MRKFSTHFGLSLSQPELDFVDIPLDGDLPVYLDPFAVSLYDDDLSRQSNQSIVAFFQAAINAIRADDAGRAERMLQRLSEPNERILGFRRESREGGVLAVSKRSISTKASRAAKRQSLAWFQNCLNATYLSTALARTKYRI
jgi:hypothetical protein